jgi:iron complex outermembrane receptor protein
MHSSLRALLSGGAACAALAIGFSAHAQTPTPEPDASGTLDEIVVTAQKRTEFAKDVPISIAVLGGESLQRQGANRLEDYVARVPGLTLNAPTVGQQQLTIRGLSTGPQGAPTVAVYIDDAPFGASNGSGAGGLVTPDIDAIDLQRIEVLRGPQGTLYGASNIGGLLKYVTVAPNTKRLEGQVAGEVNTVSHGGQGYALRGRINVPVVEDKFAVLVSAYTREDAGFIDDAGRGLKDVNETTVSGGRLAAVWTPTPALTIKAEAVLQDRHADGFGQVDVDPTTMKPLYGAHEQRRAIGSEFYDLETRQYILTGAYDFGWAQLTAVTSYGTLHHKGGVDNSAGYGPLIFDIYGVPDVGISAIDDITDKKFSQEIRLSGDLGERLSWTGGLYYTRETASTLVTLPTFNVNDGSPVPVPDLLHSLILSRYKELAAFGEVTFHATDRLDLIAGVRLVKNEQEDILTYSGDLVGPEVSIRAPSDDKPKTFSISPRFKVNDNLMLYARVASGYRPGGANGGYAPNPAFGPDTVVNYEAGVKFSAPANRVSLDLAVYRVDWKDIQLQLRDDIGFSYLANAGKARSQGVEAAATWSPVSGLTLAASGAYTDAELTEDIPSGQYGLSGSPLPYSPKWKGVLSADYDFDIAADWRGFVGASYLFTGKQQGIFTPDASIERIRLEAAGTVDLRIGVRNDRWRLEAYARNVGDVQRYNGANPLTLDPLGATAANLIQPRTLGVSLTAEF